MTSEKSNRFRKFLALLIVGFVIIFLGIIVLMIATILYGSSSASFGTIIFIGPFPIVIGAGPEATLMILFAIVLAVLSVIMFLIMHKKASV